MQAIAETLFDAVYLSSVVTIGILMIRGSGQAQQFRLFGWMAVSWGREIPSTSSPAPWPCVPPALKATPSPWALGSG